MVVAVRRSRQSLRSWDNKLKGRNAAVRVVSGQQEANREPLGTDGFVGRIDVRIYGSLWHCVTSSGKLHLPHAVNSIYRNVKPITCESLPMKTEDMLIGALLRVPAQAIQRRLIKELNAAGFDELRLPHMAVLQFPGPDGVRPATLAERAGMSKQAMNQLLRSLEGFGYIVRSDVPGEGSARQIRFTERGHAAFWKMVDILRDIEREWSIELGHERFAQLKALLFLVWDSPLVR